VTSSVSMSALRVLPSTPSAISPSARDSVVNARARGGSGIYNILRISFVAPKAVTYLG
jgi:hypothetical protein